MRDDLAPPTQEEGLRQPGDAPRARDVIRRVADVQVGDSVPAHEGVGVARQILHVEPHERRPVGTRLHPRSLEERRFGPARRAPRGPEVQDDRLTAELGQRHAPVRKRGGERARELRPERPALQDGQIEARRRHGLGAREVVVDAGASRLRREPEAE